MIYYVVNKSDNDLDFHLKSQTWYLRYGTPDIVFSMENLAADWASHELLSHIALRSFAPHTTRSDMQVGQDLVSVAGESLNGFHLVAGGFPAHSRFRDDSLEALVRERFAEDYAVIDKLKEKRAPLISLRMEPVRAPETAQS